MEDFEAGAEGWWMDGGYNSGGGAAGAVNVQSLWEISEVKSNSPTHSLFHDDNADVSRDFIFSPTFVVPEQIDGDPVVSAKVSYMLNIDNPGYGHPTSGFLGDLYYIYAAVADTQFQNVDVEGDMKYYSGYPEANSFQYLTSPVIDLTAATAPVALTFDYILTNEKNWDLGRVDILVDGEMGYTAVADLDSAGATSADVDISAFAGKSVQVRFAFLPDDGTNLPDGGLWLDNIKVADATGDLFMDDAETGNAVMTATGFTAIDRLFYDYDRVEDAGAEWHLWDELVLFNGSADLFDYGIMPGDEVMLVIRAIADETTEQGELESAGMFFDDIAVTAISGVPADAAISDLVVGYPQTSGQPTMIAATVSNLGFEAQSIPLWYQIGDAPEMPLPPYLDLDAFGDTTRVINTKFPEADSVAVSATTKLPTDMVPENDALSTMVMLEPAGMATFNNSLSGFSFFSTSNRISLVDPLAVLEGPEEYTLASVDLYMYNVAGAEDVVNVKIAKYDDDPLTPTEVVVDTNIAFDATSGVIPVSIPVDMMDETMPFGVWLDYSASAGNVGLLLDGGTPFVGNDLVYDTDEEAWFLAELGHFIFANVTYELPSLLTDITDLGGHIKSSNEDILWTGADSDGSPNGERIKFLIDNDVNTKFLVGADTSWIDYYTTTMSMVTSYALTSANDSPTRDPMHWVFQGWDAETLSWVTLDSVVDNPVWDERFESRTFEFENTEYYSNYRLHILSTNNDSQGLMQIAEWEIFGELGDMVDGDVTNYSYVTRGSNEDSLWTGPGGDGGSPDGEKLVKLVDNDINTKYLVDAVDSWLDVHSTKMSKVTSYTITSANDSPERDPNSWILKGWDRMTATWVTLDSVVGQLEWEERFQTKTFDVANADQWFSSYRLHITALNAETGPLMQIAELQLLGEIGDDVGADITDLKVEIASENDDVEWTGPSGDGIPDGERIEKLIDNNANTKFLVGLEMTWIELYTKKPSRITGYAITSANDAPTRDPHSWLVQGWDGGAWVTLDSVVAQPEWEERFQTKTWDIANDSLWFSTYRLHILDINGDAEGLMQIAELQMFGELGGNTAPQYGVTDVETKEQVVSDFRLNQNYPNPFNPTTTISFALPNSMQVKLTVFDILGREVTTLLNERISEGLHNVSFEASRYASGVYFYRLEAGDKVFQHKMMLVK
jgi:hypothetical protein